MFINIYAYFLLVITTIAYAGDSVVSFPFLNNCHNHFLRADDTFSVLSGELATWLKNAQNRNEAIILMKQFQQERFKKMDKNEDRKLESSIELLEILNNHFYRQSQFEEMGPIPVNLNLFLEQLSETLNTLQLKRVVVPEKRLKWLKRKISSLTIFESSYHAKAMEKVSESILIEIKQKLFLIEEVNIFYSLLSLYHLENESDFFQRIELVNRFELDLQVIIENLPLEKNLILRWENCILRTNPQVTLLSLITKKYLDWGVQFYSLSGRFNSIEKFKQEEALFYLSLLAETNSRFSLWLGKHHLETMPLIIELASIHYLIDLESAERDGDSRERLQKFFSTF